MRPISLRFQCFGPYMEEQFIDFEALARNGLFLICGKTGAGKTTILDAMCYALYGKSSGGQKGDRGDLSVMRCSLAKKTDETRVEFIFEAGGKRYQFVRSLKYGRKNLHDSHNCMVLEDGVYVPIFENPKKQNVNQKAEELLGLTDRQFRQVVLLPQGQFERFLVSDSAEKETILVSLFKADRWQRIVEEIFRRASLEDQELQREASEIRGRLSDYACDSVEALRALAGSRTGELELLREQAKRIIEEEKEEKDRCGRAERLHEEFVQLQGLMGEVETLRSREEEMEREEASLALADQAEAIRPLYLVYSEVRRKEKESRAELSEAGQNLENAQASLEVAQEKKKRHEAGRAEHEERLRQNTLLESAEELYASLKIKREEAEEAQRSWKRKEKELEAAKAAFDRADGKWLNAMEVQRNRIREYTAAQSEYLRGISGTLAGKLTEGEPCPVCGSKEHPSPAPTDGQRVTESELEALGSAMDLANQEVECAGGARKEAERIYQNVGKEAGDAEQNARSLWSAYGELEKRKVPGIDTQEQLAGRMAELTTAIEAYTEEERAVQALLAKARGNEQAARSQRLSAAEKAKRAKEALEAEQKSWERACRESGFGAEQEFTAALLDAAERNKRREAVIQFRTDYRNALCAAKGQEKKLEGKERPDMEALRRRAEEAEERRKQAERAMILGQQELERMEREVRILTKRRREYEVRRAKADENMEFASRLRGRSGVSLQRYVLGVMLSSVTVEANRLLRRVHGGRYQIYRTNEIAGSGHKGGLELEVLDGQSNERRSVTTLSGGEKFLVALSLAIGLSTVVQAQGSGMRLEAMFVDEGFGTLDQDSIFDALEVLQGIQRANGLVGVISHVEMLKDVIGSRIEVVKEETGSRCVIR